ncbi:MAG: GntR family transcriptional regulator [Pirellulaceae bacterium]|nr:GntR family transcriptional regulator [Pirellulaceae bacterium]
MKISLKKQAYSHIRSRIIHGSLVPGDRISHRDLAKDIGVSYTPIREAINQLVEEGLVECHARRGTFISSPRPEDVLEIADIRAGIERQLMEKLAGHVSSGALAEVRELNAQLRRIIADFEQTGGRLWVVEQARQWLFTNMGIHLTLLSEAGNRRAIKTIIELQLVTCGSGYLDQAPTLEGLLFAVDTHEKLFDALERGDAVAAGTVIKEHVEHDLLDAAKAARNGHFGKVRGWQSPKEGLAPSVIRRMKELEVD